jgi:predicted metal-dependent RNase
MAQFKEGAFGPQIAGEIFYFGHGRDCERSQMLTLISLGAAGTVTGSKHLLTHEGRHVLIDCGLFQGLKNLRELNWGKLQIQPQAIDAVILTHAHLDLSIGVGRGPRIGVQEGV